MIGTDKEFSGCQQLKEEKESEIPLTQQKTATATHIMIHLHTHMHTTVNFASAHQAQSCCTVFVPALTHSALEEKIKLTAIVILMV